MDATIAAAGLDDRLPTPEDDSADVPTRTHRPSALPSGSTWTARGSRRSSGRPASAAASTTFRRRCSMRTACRSRRVSRRPSPGSSSSGSRGSRTGLGDRAWDRRGRPARRGRGGCAPRGLRVAADDSGRGRGRARPRPRACPRACPRRPRELRRSGGTAATAAPAAPVACVPPRVPPAAPAAPALHHMNERDHMWASRRPARSPSFTTCKGSTR